MSRELLVFLFMLVLSAFFWLFSVASEVYQYDARVPVALVDVPKNVIVLDEINDTITVTIEDTGLAFLDYALTHESVSIPISFKTYNRSQGKVVVTQAELQKRIRQVLNSSTKFTLKRDGLTFNYNLGEHKRLPVHFNGTVNASSVTEYRMVPDSVDVYANKEVLKKMVDVNTKDVSIDVEKSMTTKVPMEKVSGVKCVPSVVDMEIRKVNFVEKSFEVHVNCKNEPENTKLRIFPPRVTVTFMVDVEMYHSVKDTDFTIVADYNDVAVTQSPQCSLRVSKAPTFVRNVKLSTDAVNYLIEKR